MVDYCGVKLMVKTVKYQLKLAKVSQTQAHMHSSNMSLLCATVKTWQKAVIAPLRIFFRSPRGLNVKCGRILGFIRVLREVYWRQRPCMLRVQEESRRSWWQHIRSAQPSTWPPPTTQERASYRKLLARCSMGEVAMVCLSPGASQ